MKQTYNVRLHRAQNCLVVIGHPDHVEALKDASPSWKKAVGDAQRLTQEIMDASWALDGSKWPSAAGKAEAIQEVGDRAGVILGSLHALAVDHHLPDLAATTKLGRTQITRGTATTVINRCRDIHRWAADNLVLLQEDNITEAEVAAFRQAITTLETRHTRPLELKTYGKAATAELRGLFGELKEVFHERLDKLALKFKQSAPEFFLAYRAARTFEGPPTLKEKAPEPKPAEKAVALSE